MGSNFSSTSSSAPMEDSSPEPIQAFHPAPEDVTLLRYLLLTRLPLELVDAIIDAAQYWARISVLREVDAFISSYSSHSASEWCYLITPPIPKRVQSTVNDIDKPTKVSMVKIRTLSRDQGWGGEPGCQGTYRGSYTWFEASIIRDSDSSLDPTILRKVEKSPFDMEYFRRRVDEAANPLVASGWPEIEVNGKKQWLVQRNVTASSEMKDHHIIWTRDNSADEEDEEMDIQRGCGRGQGFVCSLQAGDRIAIMARAMYPGWQNNVHAVEVEIFFAA